MTFLINTLTMFSNYLNYLFEDRNDFIKELTDNNCDCYLTGNAFCSKLFNYWYEFNDNLVDRDIYVENIHPKDLMRILIKYGDVYVYGVKNYNFRKSHKNIRFLLVPFFGISQYEFVFNHDYGSSINSIAYPIKSYRDIDNIDINKIIIDNPDLIEDIAERTWVNNNELFYFKNFENIMRCFKLCAYYGLLLKDTTINNILKSVQNITTYKKETVFEELVKILNLSENKKILQIMYDTGCFDLMNMKFKNFNKTIDEMTEMNEFDIENDIIRFIKLLDGLETDNLRRWCIANNINRSKYITNDIKKYYMLFDNCEEYLKVDTVYDMLKLLTKINNKENYGIEYEGFIENIFEFFNYYIKTIKLVEYDQEKYKNILQECKKYPISIKSIDLCDFDLHKDLNIKFNDIKKIKNNLLELIQTDLLTNECDIIVEYLKNTLN